MPLAIDHVFAFVDPALAEVAPLEAAGYVVAPRHEHPGQGTANRSVMFPTSYVELIFLASRSDAERNVLRLDRRADFRSTGECPFGIGLRGTLSDAERAAFWPYVPPYATPGRPPIWVLRRSTESAGLPLVFAMEPWGPHADAESMRPERWSNAAERGLFSHRVRSRGIASVALDLPDARGWPVPVDVPHVAVEGGGAYRMVVTLEGAARPPLRLAPHLEFRGGG